MTWGDFFAGLGMSAATVLPIAVAIMLAAVLGICIAEIATRVF